MKAWQNAEMMELNISETAHQWFGNTGDGGYIGDGMISGHSKYEYGDDSNSNNNSSTDKIS